MGLVKSGLRFVLGRNMGNLIGGVFERGRGYNYGAGPSLSGRGMQDESRLGGTQGKLSHEKRLSKYAYKQLVYPQEVGTLGDGHYIRIDIVMNNSSHQSYGSWRPSSIKETLNRKPKDFSLTEMKATFGVKEVTHDPTAWYKEGGRGFFGTLMDAAFKEGSFRTQEEQENVLKEHHSVLSSKLAAATGAVARKVNSGIQFNKNINSHQTNYVPYSIMLHATPDIEFNYKVNYANEEAGFAGDVAKLLGDGATGIGDVMGKAFSGVEIGGVRLLNTTLGAVIPGLAATMQKTTGKAINERVEVVFQNVDFREFSMKYKFAPKNEFEKQEIEKIIAVLKFHMHPELTEKENYFITPSEFVLTHMYRDKENAYIPMISRCVLKDMKVNYTPNDVVSTFAPDDIGAFPTITTVDLTFQEIEIMTKKTVGGFVDGRAY